MISGSPIAAAMSQHQPGVPFPTIDPDITADATWKARKADEFEVVLPPMAPQH